MLLINCAACAAPLAHNAPRCVRCHVIGAKGNLANTYGELGQLEKALSMERDIYSGRVKLHGNEHEDTFRAAYNLASTLGGLERFEDARSLLRRTIPAARRVLGEGHRLALKMRRAYAQSLYMDPGAMLDDLREAVGTLEETARTGRRVFGGTHPIPKGIEFHLRNARAALCARETPPRSA